MVEFNDGSILAQLGLADMKFPIQYALTYPQRPKNKFKKINLFEKSTLTFFKPDTKKFRCLKIAYNAIKSGGFAPTIMNAANEIAVSAFLQKQLRFDQIPILIEETLNNFKVNMRYNIENLLTTDAAARRLALDLIKKIKV